MIGIGGIERLFYVRRHGTQSIVTARTRVVDRFAGPVLGFGIDAVENGRSRRSSYGTAKMISGDVSLCRLKILEKLSSSWYFADPIISLQRMSVLSRLAAYSLPSHDSAFRYTFASRCLAAHLLKRLYRCSSGSLSMLSRSSRTTKSYTSFRSRVVGI